VKPHAREVGSVEQTSEGTANVVGIERGSIAGLQDELRLLPRVAGDASIFSLSFALSAKRLYRAGWENDASSGPPSLRLNQDQALPADALQCLGHPELPSICVDVVPG
jgi:hypothetical protein